MSCLLFLSSQGTLKGIVYKVLKATLFSLLINHYFECIEIIDCFENTDQIYSQLSNYLGITFVIKI
jgi:hypothetical protein